MWGLWGGGWGEYRCEWLEGVSVKTIGSVIIRVVLL